MKTHAFLAPVAAIAGLGAALAFMPASAAQAEEVTVQMHHIDATGMGKPLGTVTAFDSDNGLVLRLDLDDTLSPGAHGFHVHENGTCEPAMKDNKTVPGLAAGGHYDPKGTGTHMGPSGTGHLGDLPVIYVDIDEDGTRPVKRPLVAPRLKVSDIRGKALIIHEGGDNYRDDPKPLGGGGARVACGVVSG
ncbi:MAG: superoxide dismutase [Cu-Zn] SodC [Rhodovibrionaceae bacterium]|nr:superoxide dismutase [Cu-Zn] SodC [Rhodovibrionaceae bacterium]